MPDEPSQPSEFQHVPVEPISPPVAPAPAVDPAGLPAGESTFAATTSGLPPNIGAALSVFFPLVGGIVFLLVEKRDALTKFWAMQSVIFGVVWLVVRIAFSLVGGLFAHIFVPLFWLWSLLGVLVSLCFVAVWIVCIYQAFVGKRWEIPFLGPIARQQLARFGSRL